MLVYAFHSPEGGEMKLYVLVCLSLVLAVLAAAAHGGLPDPLGYPWTP